MNFKAIGISVLWLLTILALGAWWLTAVTADVRSDILIGIASGLMTSAVLIPVSILWSRGLVPWFEARVYSDTSIEGWWKVTLVFGEFQDPGAVVDEFRMVLKQSAHRVTGTLTGVSGPDVAKEFTVAGELRNLLLTVTYASNEPQHLDRGALTLQLVNNGGELLGTGAYYDSEQHTADWCRVKAIRARPEDFSTGSVGST